MSIISFTEKNQEKKLEFLFLEVDQNEADQI